MNAKLQLFFPVIYLLQSSILTISKQQQFNGGVARKTILSRRFIGKTQIERRIRNTEKRGNINAAKAQRSLVMRIDEGRSGHYMQDEVRNRSSSKKHQSAFRPQHSTAIQQANQTLWQSTSLKRSSEMGVTNYVPKMKPESPMEEKHIYFIAGYPDTSDPCFRRYDTCTIINAQSFERRSGIGIEDCKAFCLRLNSGLYVCKSFVYDWTNQVCDLFSHFGDQPPAKLMKYANNDYYEPNTSLEICFQRKVSFEEPAKIPKPEEDEIKYSPMKKKSQLRLEGKRTIELSGKDTCTVGTTAGYLKISNFELNENDHYVLENANLEQCLEYCTINKGGPKMAECRSVDYAKGHCVLSVETAVPSGNAQLRKSPGTVYYEKICVDQLIMRHCSPIFDRYPQMILVGYAEVVTDAATFNDCLLKCLNSSFLFGINCLSGMYYFEESKLNCILNVESRSKQKSLFVEEHSDYVDYFEINCLQDEFSKKNDLRYANRYKFREAQKLVEVQWSEWSACSANGFQKRLRSCNGKPCGKEKRECSLSNKEPIEELSNIHHGQSYVPYISEPGTPSPLDEETQSVKLVTDRSKHPFCQLAKALMR